VQHVGVDGLHGRGRAVPGELVPSRWKDRRHVDRILPDEDEPDVHAREVQATYEPVPSFRYALFSQTALDIKNGATITGDIYSDGQVTVGQNATICGSVLSSAGGVSLANGGQILKADATHGCSGKSGKVWTGGPTGIVGTQQVVISGDAVAGAPSTTTCSSTSSSYAVTISGGGTYSVQGAAHACGMISGITGETASTPA
jgi:hypothetical protein